MTPSRNIPPALSAWRRKTHEIIFEADTRAGKIFDIFLILSILLSVVVVMLDSVPEINRHWARWFMVAEWGFTILFTIEYILRLLCVRRPLKYARSFYGVIDLLAVLPSYFGLLIPEGRFFIVIRALRTLRIFRVLKLAHYLSEADELGRALARSRRKIVVFLNSVLILVVLLGSLMFIIEGARNGFTSIPRSVYWAIVTLTTVGYGDISPQTPLGQAVAAVIMITGYAIIAVPTGIVTAEISRAAPPPVVSTQACRSCASEGHDADAKYCKHCGAPL